MTILKSFFWVILAVFTQLIFGCNSGTELTVMYDTIGTLTPQSLVYCKDAPVGRVEQIATDDQGEFGVLIQIESSFQTCATSRTHFYLMADPQDREHAAIVLKQDEKTGIILKSGAIVRGERLGLLDQLVSDIQNYQNQVVEKVSRSLENIQQALTDNSDSLKAELKDSLEDLTAGISRLESLADEMLTQEEVESLKKIIDDFYAEYSAAEDAVKEKIRDDFIPELLLRMEYLEQRLNKLGLGQKSEEIERRIGEIVEI